MPDASEADLPGMSMSFSRFTRSIALLSLPLLSTAGSAQATDPKPTSSDQRASNLDGSWEIAQDKGLKACRVLLRAQKSDNGDYFLGMPPACRHAMPELATIGRWTMPDDAHLVLTEPTGKAVLKLAAAGNEFEGATGGQTYKLKRTAESGRSTAALKPVNADSVESEAPIKRIAKRAKAATSEVETKSDLTGRYAVLRDKRDTGCMLTLDQARAKGGDRAHLAPGCRDQGIVIFDPASWQLVKGELVLTARAGHKAHLLKNGEGTWAKDPKDGGKPLGLKKL